MPKVIHFEIPADNPDRAVAFYQKAFGWKVDKWDGPEDYWLATAGESGEPGINGAITRRSSIPNVTNTIGVASLDESVKRIADAGGTIILSRMTVPGVGYLAYGQDTEGNTFGVLQPDSSAT
jgi:predicted enzyme related to lactoylglutathione lyase